MSMAAWVRYRTHGDHRPIINFHEMGSGNKNFIAIRNNNNPNMLGVEIKNAAGSDISKKYFGHGLATETWAHIVFTLNA